MNRKLMILLVVFLIVLMTAACGVEGNDEDPADQEQTFNARILEIDESGLLLEPLEGEEILRSGDRVMVGQESLDEDSLAALAEGDEVLVTFSSGVMESYPLQLGNLISIEPIE